MGHYIPQHVRIAQLLFESDELYYWSSYTGAAGWNLHLLKMEKAHRKTPLIVALKHGYSRDIIEGLLEMNSIDKAESVIKQSDINGSTPLHHAVQSNAPLEVIEYPVDTGGDANLQCPLYRHMLLLSLPRYNKHVSNPIVIYTSPPFHKDEQSPAKSA